jgi:hypothetical protein
MGKSVHPIDGLITLFNECDDAFLQLTEWCIKAAEGPTSLSRLRQEAQRPFFHAIADRRPLYVPFKVAVMEHTAPELLGEARKTFADAEALLFGSLDLAARAVCGSTDPEAAAAPTREHFGRVLLGLCELRLVSSGVRRYGTAEGPSTKKLSERANGPYAEGCFRFGVVEVSGLGGYQWSFLNALWDHTAGGPVSRGVPADVVARQVYGRHDVAEGLKKLSRLRSDLNKTLDLRCSGSVFVDAADGRGNKRTYKLIVPQPTPTTR